MVQHPDQITAEVASPTRPAFAAIGGHQRTTGIAQAQVHRPAHDDGTAVVPPAPCS
jgi:hypothetical protein